MMTSISPLPLDMEWVAESAGNAMFNDRCRGILRPDWSDQLVACRRATAVAAVPNGVSAYLVKSSMLANPSRTTNSTARRNSEKSARKLVIKANVETAIRLLDKARPGRRLTANLVALIDPDATLAAQFAGYFSKVDALLGHFIPVRHPQPFRRNTTPGMP
ncbi:hypothetical protein [Burkholderia ubonensis]|uniref:hypothetical protein n=1 Tax=Burkholderia ubonensis TaxID=101571 RepID=UPI00158274E7|nr:hypothetical protein [Burkholderia ubonensis]